MTSFRALARLLFALTLFLGTEAAAQSCASLVQQQFDFMKLGGNRFVMITGISLRPATPSQQPLISHFSGYVNGYVPEYYVQIPNGIRLRMPARLTSPANNGVQFFDDRTYVTTQSGTTDTQHFSVFAPDKLQFELDDTGALTVTLNTWSNIKHTVSSPTCNGNVMTGYVSTLLYAFTFRQLNLTLP
ncbi:hypothetical protein LZ198_21675 [Myxococcus sp. K15C18031901]|uniref:hypothetical protein n=1 Tax=Myxococcus dinghuensis TaxID=2906761 RepID=UPI0020A81139|nr:hypothetical protein [Myxococcus dinghuensis]MCP3101489.1 hypothetical protein [Myxococcus dinghuensis]